MTLRLSNRALQTPPSPIRRLSPLARAARAKGTNVYYLNIGQPDIASPQEFFDGIRSYNSKVLAYEISEGNIGLRTSWANSASNQLGIKLEPENFLITTGASEALVFLFMTVCDPGDEIIIFDPTYANYIGFSSISGAKLIPVLTNLKNNFSLPSDEVIKAKITKKTSAILLCNPNNPTGTVYSKEELQRLIRICTENDIFLIVDETYREFVYDDLKPLSVLQLEKDNPRIVVVDSLSKRFSLCGARIGSIISTNKDLLAKCLNLAQARLSVSTIEQVAASYMLEKIDATYINRDRDEYQKRRDVLYEGLSKIPGLELLKPQGAFYMVVKLPVESAEDFACFMLNKFSHEKSTVFVAPASGFYMTPNCGLDEIRIAYVLNTEDIKKAVHLLELGLDSYLSYDSE